MDANRIGWKILLTASLCAVAVVVATQGQALAGAAGRSLSEPELEQMVAPIALYPDDLVAHVLRAATHPAEVAEANRWVTQAGAAAATDDSGAEAAAGQSWNSSVKALVAVPQVLAMMAGDPAWTEALGRAYMTQEPALLGAIQALRRRAEAAGNLRSNSEQLVASDGSDIVIDPAEPGSLAVPYYDPNQVYGAWPWYDYPPMTLFSPFDDFGLWGPAIAFETIIIVGPHWHRHHVDWRRHHVDRAPSPPATAIGAAAAASRASVPSGVAPVGPVAPAASAAAVTPQRRWQAAPVGGGFAHVERAPERRDSRPDSHPWSGRELRRSFPATATPAAVPVRPPVMPRAAVEPVRRVPEFGFQALRPRFQVPRSAATFPPARGSFHAEESRGGGHWRR